MNYVYTVECEQIGPFAEPGLVVHTREPFPLSSLRGWVFNGGTLHVFRDAVDSAAYMVHGFALRKHGALIDSGRCFALGAVNHPEFGPCLLCAETAVTICQP